LHYLSRVQVRHVYVHVPFCARRCSYCDFAIAVRRVTPVDAFLDSISREIELRAGAEQTPVDTIYCGGGTPSRLGPDGVQRLLDIVRRRFRPERGAEVTLEANPEDVDLPAARAWRAAGVNRVSLGVQSFDDQVLRWMHRTHDAGQARNAVHVLRDAGFEDWSLDLIFALPPEVTRDWTADLDQALALEPPHVSCYGLTVEPHTPLERWRSRGQVHDADEERYAEEFLEADLTLTARGYEHYEVSNYSMPGHRARHNSAYWLRVPYAGFGPSAHSFDGVTRRWNLREFAAWQERLSVGVDPVGGTEVVSAESAALESAYLGLRSLNGIAVTPATAGEFALWRDRGWASVVDGMCRLTPSGWLRLDAIVARLTDVRSR
jgi:oxygen-independent coproporphyrinogen-3 oxidase